MHAIIMVFISLLFAARGNASLESSYKEYTIAYQIGTEKFVDEITGATLTKEVKIKHPGSVSVSPDQCVLKVTLKKPKLAGIELQLVDLGPTRTFACDSTSCQLSGMVNPAFGGLYISTFTAIKLKRDIDNSISHCKKIYFNKVKNYILKKNLGYLMMNHHHQREFIEDTTSFLRRSEALIDEKEFAQLLGEFMPWLKASLTSYLSSGPLSQRSFNEFLWLTAKEPWEKPLDDKGSINFYKRAHEALDNTLVDKINEFHKSCNFYNKDVNQKDIGGEKCGAISAHLLQLFTLRPGLIKSDEFPLSIFVDFLKTTMVFWISDDDIFRGLTDLLIMRREFFVCAIVKQSSLLMQDIFAQLKSAEGDQKKIQQTLLSRWESVLKRQNDVLYFLTLHNNFNYLDDDEVNVFAGHARKLSTAFLSMLEYTDTEWHKAFEEISNDENPRDLGFNHYARYGVIGDLVRGLLKKDVGFNDLGERIITKIKSCEGYSELRNYIHNAIK